MATLELHLNKATGKYELPAPGAVAKAEPEQLDLHARAGVMSEIVPVIGGGLAALVGAQLVNGFAKPGIITAVIKGTGAMFALRSRGEWAHIAGYFLLFDAALDIFPLDKMVAGLTGGLGGLLGGGGGATTVSAQQQGGQMSIDQLYGFLKGHA